jgi:predicted DNA-binding transcriptional regulator AlpA
MARRKADKANSPQMDMFGGWVASSLEQRPTPAMMTPESRPIEVANDDAIGPAVTVPEVAANDTPIPQTDPPIETKATSQALKPTSPKVMIATGWENDEWWTTAMVCAYLKLGRKAIWERTRNPKIGFPKPTHFGSCRHRWRAGEVKAWSSNQCRPSGKSDESDFNHA